jgi:hypothetical protein
MRVDDVLTLEDYDMRAIEEWPHRIPNLQSDDLNERLGDCIYDYSREPPRQRRSVHGPQNVDTDLSGKNALISRHFYYFGRSAISLPEALWEICYQTQGHRSNSNAPFVDEFVLWLENQEFAPGQHGQPDYVIDWNDGASCSRCTGRQQDGENDNSY